MPSYNVNISYDYTESQDSDSDYSDDEEDNIYEAEEQCPTHFTIALCELYNEKRHGKTSCSVKYHYLVNIRFKQFKQIHMNDINEYVNFLNILYIHDVNIHHDIFRNYRNMILNSNYIKPEIVKILKLKDCDGNDYSIAIIKTFWLKIVQRTWKNIIKKRKEIILKRKHLVSLFWREINGKWPNNCLQYPSLKGMLSNLKI